MASVQIVKLHKLAIKNIILAMGLIFTYPLNLNSVISHGIHNCSNSCYFNSSIQLLAHIPPLTRLLHEKATNKQDKFLTEFYINFINKLYKNNINEEESNDFYTMTLQAFTNKKGKQIFKTGNQEDAHEFLSYMINYLRSSYNPNIEKLEEEIAKSPNDTNLHARLKTASEDFDNIIYSKLITKSVCGLCKNTSIKEELLNILSLEITNKYSLIESLNTFFQATETRDDKNICDHTGETKYYFPEDNKQEFTRIKGQYPNLTINPSEAPFKRIFYFSYISDYLIIQLKRFNNPNNKINDHVKFPLSLNLQKYQEKKQAPQLYKLSAIIYHSGSLHGGHYWALAQGEDGQWRKFNDNNVSNYTNEQIIQLSNQQVNRETAYIFLYKKDSPAKGILAPQLTPEEQAKQTENLKNQLEKLNESLKKLKKNLEILRTQLITLQGKL